MNAKKTIATIGLTGVLGLTTIGGVTPAMASDHGGTEKHKGNSVSQAAHTKEKGESNREAAHAHAYGKQEWKQWKNTDIDPVVTAPVVTAPVVTTPVDTSPETNIPVEAPIGNGTEVDAPVTAPIEAPVDVSPVVEAPVGNVSTGDILNGNSLIDSVLSDDKVGETNTDLGETTTLGGVTKFF